MTSTVPRPVDRAETRHNTAGACWALTLTCGHAVFRAITSDATGQQRPAPTWADCAQCRGPRRA